MCDLIIKGGFVVDGSRAPGATMDIAIEGDRIVALGRIDGSARRVIDADGALVTSGFINVRTHYDGQAHLGW